MTTEKVTVTVPCDVLAQARAAVDAGEASSVSAYVTQAVTQRVERERRAGAIAQRWGPFSDEALTWAWRVADSAEGQNLPAS
ncbi:MAG TPA: hypothetical protein VFX70_02090 [Mycobacteriales bacterium]|nr:hypothetical protein [Mycobacteriales bacterium]